MLESIPVLTVASLFFIGLVRRRIVEKRKFPKSLSNGVKRIVWENKKLGDPAAFSRN